MIAVGQPRVVMPEADPPPAEKEVLGIYITQKIGSELFEEAMFSLDIKRVLTKKLTLWDDTGGAE